MEKGGQVRNYSSVHRPSELQALLWLDSQSFLAGIVDILHSPPSLNIFAAKATWKRIPYPHGIPVVDSFASNYKCIAGSNKCLTGSNKKLVISILIVTTSKALVTSSDTWAKFMGEIPETSCSVRVLVTLLAMASLLTCERSDHFFRNNVRY